MAYVVLARKWRPQRFEDVVGQEHITRTLASAITQERVAHGYLFCGPRGVGKTTTARILAKALNCEKGPTPTPCNECTTCKDVDVGRSLDIIEVDGASTRGIDDVRELRESVRYAPTGGRTKVYIIDEVHMLTREAFNALLKTLEEPPPHVVFVMATTEPFKVPATILSRCQRFDFARIHPKAIMDQLERIVKSEGFKVQRDALAVLARRSQGGLRDALSTLDQVLSSAENEITAEMVNGVLGILSLEFYFKLTDALIDGDAESALRQLDEVYHAGADLGELTEELARHLRNVMILSVGASMGSVLEDLGPAEVARVAEQAKRLTPTAASRLLETALRGVNQMRRSEHVRLHLEMTIVEMASLGDVVSIGEVIGRLENMERRLGGDGPPHSGGGGSSAAGSKKPRPSAARSEGTAKRKAAPPGPSGDVRLVAVPPAAPPSNPVTETVPEAAAAAAVLPADGAPPSDAASPAAEAPTDADLADSARVSALWDRTIEEVKKQRMGIGAFLMGSRARVFDAEGCLLVQVDKEHSFYKSNLEDRDNARFIEAVIAEVFGRRITYKVVVGDVDPAMAAGAAPASAGSLAIAEPAELQEKAPEPSPAPQKTPFEIAGTDPAVQKVIELFDGEVSP